MGTRTLRLIDIRTLRLRSGILRRSEEGYEAMIRIGERSRTVHDNGDADPSTALRDPSTMLRDPATMLRVLRIHMLSSLTLLGILWIITAI